MPAVARAKTIQLEPNARQRMDGLEMLRAMNSDTVAAAFYDPQHRAVLDQMKYGNEGARQQGRAALQAMPEPLIVAILLDLARVLRPGGHIFFWVDKFCLASGKYLEWLQETSKVTTVDLISWNKMRIGMGRRARCSTEYLLVLQKEPARAKDIWVDHSIPDSWTEQHDRDIHPHAKPYVLTERLIRCVTKRGDLIVDPCAGGYGVLSACKASGRVFMGCDIAE